MEFSEKRQYERIQLTLPVNGRCLGTGEKTHPFEGETKNVCFKGLCIKINSFNGFEAGQKVKFSTRLYQGDFLIKGEGNVCWIHPLSNPDWPISMGVIVTRMQRYGLWLERIEDKIIQMS